MNTLPLGKLLLDRLYGLGVHHIFGLPGDYVLRLDKMIEQHPIKFINTTRENTAGYMADAYARLRGLGAACITYGVGVNIVNALSLAYVENSPIVVISGTAGTDELQQGQKLHHLIHRNLPGQLDTTQLEIFKQVTIDQAVLDDPSNAPAVIDRVLNACLRYKKPVYIEIPRNRVESPVVESPFHLWPAQKSNEDNLKEALAEVSQILDKARKPLLWIGHELQRLGLVEPLMQFAEKYQLPIVTSLMGKTTISEKHPLFIGVYCGAMSKAQVKEFVDNCDCALILGLSLTDLDTGVFTTKLEPSQTVIANEEKIKIHHHYYHDVFFQDFIKGLGSVELKKRPQFENPIQTKPVSFAPKKDQKTTIQRLFECIQTHLKPEHIIITDVGDCLFAAMDLVLEQNAFFASAYFATLGFATPGAVGAQIAVPDKRVIAIVGDGAFQMTSMELSTAVRYALDPVIIVLNNHGYGTERPLLEGPYNDIQNWNYAEIPRVLGGGIGIRVATEEEMDAAIKEAFSNRGQFYLIEVEMDKMDFSPALQRFGKLLNQRHS